MSRAWVENEAGPLCSCGMPLFVKKAGENSTQYGLLCFTHTREAGAWVPLPDEAPDEWLVFPDDVGDEVGEACKQMTVDGQVGAFVPLPFAKYFATLIRQCINEGQPVPSYYLPAFGALYRLLRTAEAERTEKA